MSEVLIVSTGVANVASLLSALERVGAQPRLAGPGDDLRRAARVVLPGVGTFGAAGEALRRSGWEEAVRARIAADLPTLCVCVGLQVLAGSSQESPGTRGLGIFSDVVERFPAQVRAPQLGWNGVEADADARWLRSGAAYFANGYRLTEAPAGWRVAWSNHGGLFVAGLERGNVLACQFHPELSGDYGLSLLRRWLGQTAESPAAEVLPGLTPRVIPCLDVRDGRVVKGVRFQGLRDAGDPVEQAAAYQAQGADELVILDVSAGPEQRATALDTVRAVRDVLSIPLTVGGGVRKLDDVGALLTAGADKVAVNTAAVRQPSLLTELNQAFGAQCTVVSVDAARAGDGWEVVVGSGRERPGLDAVAWARQAVELGAGEVLLTSWDRDGTQSGYDTELLAAVAGQVGVPVIASGGAKTAADLAAALAAGADAVLAASIFHDGLTTVDRIKGELTALGVAVRAQTAPASPAGGGA